MKESFYYSNMSPQLPAFNRGVWKKLEEQVREWALAYDHLLIATGPILHDSLPKIGTNRVSVPSEYYKVLIDIHLPELKGIGFLLPNAASGKSVLEFAVPIDSIEKITGIDFFHLLPDSIENILESQACVECWPIGKPKYLSPKPETKTCMGTTKAGNRCKNKPGHQSMYCHLHQKE